MDDRIQYCIDAELRFARAKFPGSNLNFPALVEEVGELSKALLDHSFGKLNPNEVFAEAIQVAVMAIRVAEEGSSEFPYQFEHSHYQSFNVNKLPNPKIEKPVEAFVWSLNFTGKNKAQISADFLRRVQSAGCQCGRQKLEGKPLCGICFSRLPDEVKEAMRRKRGGELEDIYHQACEFLIGKTSQFSRGRKRDV